MKLKDYLEYMTPEERRVAGNAGQTNLIKSNDILPEGLLKEKEEYYSKIGDRNIKYILKNSVPDSGGYRICMCYNGNYYTCQLGISNHDQLAHKAYFDRQFPELTNKNYIRDWWEYEESINSFLCLTVRETINSNNVYLAESYEYSHQILAELKTNKKIRKHYVDLCQNKLNKRLIYKTLNTY